MAREKRHKGEQAEPRNPPPISIGVTGEAASEALLEELYGDRGEPVAPLLPKGQDALETLLEGLSAWRILTVAGRCLLRVCALMSTSSATGGAITDVARLACRAVARDAEPRILLREFESRSESESGLSCCTNAVSTMIQSMADGESGRRLVSPGAEVIKFAVNAAQAGEPPGTRWEELVALSAAIRRDLNMLRGKAGAALEAAHRESGPTVAGVEDDPALERLLGSLWPLVPSSDSRLTAWNPRSIFQPVPSPGRESQARTEGETVDLSAASSPVLPPGQALNELEEIRREILADREARIARFNATLRSLAGKRFPTAAESEKAVADINQTRHLLGVYFVLRSGDKHDGERVSLRFANPTGREHTGAFQALQSKRPQTTRYSEAVLPLLEAAEK